jgi:hypothetical protein
MAHPTPLPVSGLLFHSITPHAQSIPVSCFRPAGSFHCFQCPTHPPSLFQACFFIQLLPKLHQSNFPVSGLLLHSITPNARPVPLPHFRPASSFHYSQCPTRPPSLFQACFFIPLFPMPHLSPFLVSGPLLHSITLNALPLPLPHFRLASSFHLSPCPTHPPSPF